MANVTPGVLRVSVAPWLLFAVCSSLALAVPARVSAQTPGILTAYRFHLNAARLAADDDRFVWDVDYGGDIDLGDYGRGRLNFLANYEAILGRQFRDFDPNQGNYTLDLSASLRLKAGEVAVVFHHMSRHLSDRPKPFSIDWNMAGVQYIWSRRHKEWHVDGTARALGGTKKTFVDYRSEIGATVAARYPADAPHSAIAALAVTAFGVDNTILGRGHQYGARIEAGVRLARRRAAGEWFVGVERRVDAHPFAFVPRTWALVGFRLLSR